MNDLKHNGITTAVYSGVIKFPCASEQDEKILRTVRSKLRPGTYHVWRRVGSVSLDCSTVNVVRFEK